MMRRILGPVLDSMVAPELEVLLSFFLTVSKDCNSPLLLSILYHCPRKWQVSPHVQ